MNRRSGRVSAAIVLCLTLAALLPCLALENQHSEDFTTTLYEDAVNTTADWNTAAGELRLFPFVPTIVGNVAYSEAWDIALAGEHAYVADGPNGFRIFDISDPSSPSQTGFYNTPGNARGIDVQGDCAFVADGSWGLRILDLRFLVAPTPLGFLDTPGYARDVVVAGDCAFVADTDYGLHVVDVADPANPALIGGYDTPGEAMAVAVAGDHAFVADGSAGLLIFDITDPANPALIGTYDTADDANDVVVAGYLAFVADGATGLVIVDISDPTTPSLHGVCDTPGDAVGVELWGDEALVADGASGLQAIDITDPSNPVPSWDCDTPGEARRVAAAGGIALVADRSSGLEIIEIAKLTGPTPIGSCVTNDYAMGVAVSGDLAFVPIYESGLQILDISDPAAPAILGATTTPFLAWNVAVSGGFACVASVWWGLHVVDVSDPANPILIGSYDTTGEAHTVSIAGDLAFVADGPDGLASIDIGTPAAPALLDTYPTGHAAIDVAVSGNHAYVACSGDGLVVIDVTDPTLLTLLGSLDTDGFAWGVAVSGDLAYLADGDMGLKVIDVSDPTKPTLLSAVDTPGTATAVEVSGSTLIVGDGGFGFHLFDVADPANPVLVESYETENEILGSVISGACVFAADGFGGLLAARIFQTEVEAETGIGQSLAVDTADDTILRARLATTQTDAADWELSADGGANWQTAQPDATWQRMLDPGADLMWRASLTWLSPGDHPAVAELEIEWLVEAAAIVRILDVPDDQGGWVRARFLRSGLDFADETALPIASYGIWRQVDDPALAVALKTAPAGLRADDGAPDLGDVPVTTYGGRTYVRAAPGAETASFPEGTWAWVAAVPAVQQDVYDAVVPTVADSSASGRNAVTLLVTAHTTTPSVWYAGEPGDGCSVDNIAPEAPANLAVAYSGDGNQLAWDPCPDEDFHYFNIYRSTDPGFVPSPADLVHSATGASWIDPEPDGWDVHYKVTALDYAGNESDAASPGSVTAVGDPSLPRAYGLHPNVPNPFNPSTTIRYDVPAGGGAVTFRVYDVQGKLVRTLVDGMQTGGRKSVTWDGRNDRGRSVSSGVYFYRLQSPGFAKTLKMTLVQ